MEFSFRSVWKTGLTFNTRCCATSVKVPNRCGAKDFIRSTCSCANKFASFGLFLMALARPPCSPSLLLALEYPLISKVMRFSTLGSDDKEFSRARVDAWVPQRMTAFKQGRVPFSWQMGNDLYHSVIGCCYTTTWVHYHQTVKKTTSFKHTRIVFTFPRRSQKDVSHLGIVTGKKHPTPGCIHGFR